MGIIELSYTIKFKFDGDAITEENARKETVKMLREKHNIEARPHDLKGEQKSINITWHIEDVLEIRPDLTKEQAYEVLCEVEDNHDADYGVTWNSIRDTANVVFPENNDEENNVSDNAACEVY